MRHFISIPEELRKYNRWVCWSMEDRDSKPTKIPKNPKTGGNAMANNPDTWGSFKQAVDRMKSDKFAGIGFMFNGDGIIGVDIDGCRDKETGELTEQAKEIIEILDSYTEISASGKGIHIICRGSLPEGKRRHGPVEMYDNLRYFIMTGQVIDNRNIIQDRAEQLASVHEKYINVKKTQKNVSKKTEIVTNLDDDDIIEKALAAKNGDLFTDLMNGNWKHRYQSQSEADIALSNLLAFWTGKDIEQMNRIFRRSGLYRDKWDEARPGGSYGSMTMENSINNCQEVYSPHNNNPKNKEEPERVIAPEDDEESFEQLVKEYEQIEDEKKKSFSLDDIGNAERLVHKYGENIRYCFPFKEWLVWDSTRWKSDNKGEIHEMARQTARGILAEAWAADDAKRNAILNHVKKSCQSYALKAMIDQGRSIPGIPILPSELDNNHWLLNVANGTVNLKTGELMPHNKEHLITKISPIIYDKNAKAPIWEKFLHRIFDNNTELILFMQRAIGYSLTASVSEQCFFMCHGSGQNGKTTLLNVLNELLGDYGKVSDMDSFTDRRNNSATNDIAVLHGARLVTMEESNDGIRLNEALVKKLTGGGKVTARKLYAELFEFEPYFKMWMAVNHLPIIKGTDLGIWRRIRLIPFNVQIPDSEKDKDLGEKLKKELPGILKWAVEGCLEWQKQGLNPPAIVQAATTEYQEDQDIFADFIGACCVTGPGIKTRGDQLYSEYKKYCDECGYKALTIKRFIRAMRDRGYVQETDRSRRYFWLGIGIAASDDVKDAFKDTFWSKQ